MNREYKFRGKRVGDGKWIYGSLIHLPNMKNGYDCVIIPQDACLWTPLSEGLPICSNKWHHVDINTVGQYTGLKDKNDKEIFKGDIVKCVDLNSDIEFIAAVEFGNPNYKYTWGYQLSRISGDNPNLDILLWVDMDESRVYCEVIGNIHDNPELLKEAANE